MPKKSTARRSIANPMSLRYTHHDIHDASLFQFHSMPRIKRRLDIFYIPHPGRPAIATSS